MKFALFLIFSKSLCLSRTIKLQQKLCQRQGVVFRILRPASASGSLVSAHGECCQLQTALSVEEWWRLGKVGGDLPATGAKNHTAVGGVVEPCTAYLCFFLLVLLCFALGAALLDLAAVFLLALLILDTVLLVFL
ncbi:hypothetical protein EV682_102267 [Iodobacter fluviatilis]|uniref:Uncharacterized protein n=1 Tax=Iodobacter fluviatilis TaxID=537 RepID=A0A377Q7J6_9NEIS|nr:hypothetical protein EV682_102267 [Iodobacter fluviatilis]STQ90725.1 Uncharacterised protein [Iodobacter fluviatilis]